MYNSKLLKRYTTPNTAPTADELSAGELVINSVDGTLYTKTAQDNRVHIIGTPAIEQVAGYVTTNIGAFQSIVPNKGMLIVGDGTTWLPMPPSTKDGDLMVTDSSQAVGIGWGTLSIVNCPTPTQTAFTINGATGQTYNLMTLVGGNDSIVATISAEGYIRAGGTVDNQATPLYGTVFAVINNAVNTGYYADLSYTLSSLGQNAVRSLYSGQLIPTIAVGYHDTGAVYGVNLNIARQNTDAGILDTLAGVWITYGNNHQSATTSTITYNYGILLQPCNSQGVILEQYDLYIDAPSGTVQGAFGQLGSGRDAHYGIYQKDTTASNYLGGITGIGHTGDGSSSLDILQTTPIGCAIAGTLTTTSSSNTYCSLALDLNKVVAAGVAESGNTYGIQSNVLVTGASGGLLPELIAYSAIYGSVSTVPIDINAIYGIMLIPQVANVMHSGSTGTTLYDLFIASAIGSGTIAGHWSVYQQDAGASNFWAGLSMFGGTTTTPSLIYAQGNEAQQINTAVLIDHENIITVGCAKQRTTLEANLGITLGSGVGDSGTSCGLNNTTQTIGPGNGSLSQLIGISNQYGHNLNTGAGGSIIFCCGAQFQPMAINGNIANLYDLRILAVAGTGTVDTHYSIYQEDANSINFLGGNLLIGNPTWTYSQISAQYNDSGALRQTGYMLAHSQITNGTRNSDQTGVYIDFTLQVPNGNEWGVSNGLTVNAFRTDSSSNTANSLTGAIISYGSTGGTGALTYSYGLRLTPRAGTNTSTINKMYDLYIDAITGNTPGVHYGIYQADSNITNVFAGLIQGQGGLEADSPGTTAVPLVVKGHTAQSGNLTEWRNSSGILLANIDANGVLYTPTIQMGSLQSAGPTYTTPLIGTWDLHDGTGSITISNATSTLLTIGKGTTNPQFLLGIPTATMAVKGASGQTAPLMSWYTSDGTLQANLSPTGGLTLGAGGLTLITSGTTATMAYETDGLLHLSNGLSGGCCGGSTLLVGVNDGTTGNHWTVDGGVAPQLGVRSTVITRPTLTVQAMTYQTADLQEWQGSDGSTLLRVDSYGRLVSTTPTPTITAGPGAGADPPTLSITGTDVCGSISLTAGTVPGGNTAVVTVIFHTAYGQAPKLILLTPANALTADLAVFANQQNISATQFTLDIGTTSLVAGSVYQWYYLVIG